MKREFIKSPITSDWAFWVWIIYSGFIWISQFSGRIKIGTGIAGIIDLLSTSIATFVVVLILFLIPRFIFWKIKDRFSKNSLENR